MCYSAIKYKRNIFDIEVPDIFCLSGWNAEREDLGILWSSCFKENYENRYIRLFSTSLRWLYTSTKRGQQDRPSIIYIPEINRQKKLLRYGAIYFSAKELDFIQKKQVWKLHILICCWQNLFGPYHGSNHFTIWVFLLPTPLAPSSLGRCHKL